MLVTCSSSQINTKLDIHFLKQHIYIRVCTHCPVRTYIVVYYLIQHAPTSTCGLGGVCVSVCWPPEEEEEEEDFN